MAGSKAPRGSTGRKTGVSIDTRALLLRAVPVGEADLLLTLFTVERGVISAAARSARRSTRRFGALEPIHELTVVVELREGVEIGRLVDARIERTRLRVTSALERVEAAGQLLRWIRRASPMQVAEPQLFAAASRGLDALDAPDPVRPAAVLAGFGLILLEALGWGLDLEACVACGRRCPDTAPAFIDPHRGGLVCRACGGARRILPTGVRRSLLEARAERAPLDDAAAVVAVELVEAVLEAHVAPRGPSPQAGPR